MLSGNSHGLRILPPNLTSQILVVFYDDVFCDFFKYFQKNINFKKFKNFVKFSILLLKTVRVLSELATLASEYDCSNLCCFGDMTVFRIFSKFFKELRYRHRI